jgi:SAM-dependent methyltransferase
MQPQFAERGNPSRQVSSDDANARMWRDVGAEWIAGSHQSLWRRHSDRVASALIARWMPTGVRSVLKTDLFDEAISEGLYATLQSRAAAVHGIDISQTTVQGAQRRHPGLEAHVSDIKSLPFADAAFDMVVSLSTLDHFSEREEIEISLREIRRVTAPGGRLLLTLDNPMNPKIALRGAVPEWMLLRTGLVPYHCGVTLPRDKLVDAVQRAGFRVIEVTAIVHCPRVLAVRLAALITALSSPRLERGLLKVLPWFERLERWPTRWRTGHFTAILAEARD